MTLRNLAKGNYQDVIVSEEGALAGLVKALSEVGGHLRIRALEALTNLSGAEDDLLKQRIGNEHGVLEGVVETLLGDNDFASSREIGARFLQNLADVEDSSLKQKLAHEDGVIRGLVKCLNVFDTTYLPQQFALREQAASALATLADTEDASVKLKITDEPGFLSCFVQFLSAGNGPRLQELAARALTSLAKTKEDSIKRRIATEPGMLAAFVNCLSALEYPCLRQYAATALASLNDTTDVSINEKIADEKEALAGLVMCLEAI